jgi:two-component system response regulator YesN
MYNLVIVDDELLIREGLKKYLNWEEFGFKLSGEAADGILGIELCRQLKPDLVITDIRMPGKDGIELIATLKCELKDTKFIILSGFGEFELAQKAIRAGASDYILKPLQKEHFLQTINNIRVELDKSFNDKSSNNQLSSLIQKNTFLLKNSLIANLLGGNSSDYAEELHFFNIKSSCFRILAVNYSSSEKIGNEEEANRLQRVSNIVGNFAAVNRLSWHIGSYDGYIVVLCCMNENETDSFRDDLNSLIYEVCKEYELKLYVGIGSTVIQLTDIKKSYTEALDNLKSMFYQWDQQIFDDKLEYIEEDLTKKYFAKETETLFTSAIQNGDQNKLESVYFSVIEKLNLSGYHEPEDIRNFFMKMLMRVYSSTSDVIKEDYNTVMDIIKIQNNYRDLIEYVNGRLTRHCSVFSKEGLDSKKLIMEIKKFIQCNISEEITLNTIAAKFHMNLFYVSHLFKKEAGINFLDYLTSLRVEKAKELLADVNNKIYEVAVRVGYDDQRYFSQVFKKYTGYTPMEYRDKRG